MTSHQLLDEFAEVGLEGSDLLVGLSFATLSVDFILGEDFVVFILTFCSTRPVMVLWVLAVFPKIFAMVFDRGHVGIVPLMSFVLTFRVPVVFLFLIELSDSFVDFFVDAVLRHLGSLVNTIVHKNLLHWVDVDSNVE